MKRSSRIFCIGFLLVSQCLAIKGSSQNQSPFNQVPNFISNGNSQAARPDTSASMTKLIANATEDISQRTLVSSTFKTADGQIIKQFSSQLLNYYNEKNELVPIKIELKSNASGWVADQQPNPCYFHLDRSTGISCGDRSEIKFNVNSKVNGILYQQQIVGMNKNEVDMDLTSDIHKKITYLINGIETDYIIDRPIGDALEVSEEVDFPKGATFGPDKKSGKYINGKWAGSYVLLSADGKQLVRFKTPLCHDAVGKTWCMGYYRDEVNNGKHVLYTGVPTSWLSHATYPVTIDPVITGPVTHWPTGISIPSDIYPAFYTDSILITIPGLITITRFYVSFCFQTNNGIYYKYGRIYLKTPCATTPILACDSVDPNHPGTCYIDTSSNKNDFGPQSPYFRFPLTCCFNPLCTQQQFYLTVGLSRDCPASAPCKPPNGADSTTWIFSPSLFDGNPFPFYAFIVGNTDQVNSWSVTPTTVCSDVCHIDLNINAQYGVPPYTIVHPWAAGNTVIGTATTCNLSQGSATIPLTIPGCPTYCGATKTINVPAPIVYDFCNDTVKGLTPKTITINPVPKITSLDSIKVCSGTPVNIKVSSCLPNTLVTWKGPNNTSGTDSNISVSTVDTTNSVILDNYTIFSSYLGCKGDTDKVVVKINPSPTLKISKDTTILDGNSANLVSNTNGASYSWSPPDGLSCTTCANPVASPSVTTTYTILSIGADGCTTLDSVTIYVTPREVIIPNIFTPNDDGINDVFKIKNLEYYPNSQLVVFDRWGVKVYETSNYPNNWFASGVTDGTYYYVLTLTNGKKYDGFVQILR
jgi:gliding motility-associated-like protein